VSTILYVGKLSYGKGVDLLVDALPEIIEQIGEVEAVFVGEGPLLWQLREQICGWGLDYYAAKVGFLGQVPHAEVCALYRDADVTVIPSRWQEPFGRVALEALWYDCPIVVTNRGGLPEIAAYGPSEIVEPTGEEYSPLDIAAGVVRMLRRERGEEKYSSPEYSSRHVDRDLLRWVFGDVVRDKHMEMYEGLT